MANKIYLDRLKKRYGYHNETYQALIHRILAVNHEMVKRRVGEVSRDQWRTALGKIGHKEQTYVIPSLDQVLPKRSIDTLKAAQHGKLITDTLRDALTKNMRDALNQFTPKTREQTYIRRRGALAGQVNPKLIREFQTKIRETFQNYTKVDPKFGMPSNIKNIAVTEMRSAIATIKREFTSRLIHNNPNVEFWKTWIHNPALSKQPRPGHVELHGVTLPYHEPFKIHGYRQRDGRMMRTGRVYATDAPHSESLPADQVIGCNCDVGFLAKWKS